MLTDRQREAAERALIDNESQKLKKKVLLRAYRRDQERAERWQLPFRMIHRHEYISGEVYPNDYYPRMSNIGRDADGNPYTIEDAERIDHDTAIFYFTRILAANESNLLEYTAGDWTGNMVTPDKAEWYRQTYLDRIQDFLEHPKRYDTKPHPMPDHPEQIYFMLEGMFDADR